MTGKLISILTAGGSGEPMRAVAEASLQAGPPDRPLEHPQSASGGDTDEGSQALPRGGSLDGTRVIRRAPKNAA
jgi:hypothetical protein